MKTSFTILLFALTNSIYGQTASYYDSIGVKYHERKQYTKALESFDKAILLSPSEGNAFYHKAFLNLALKNIDEAVIAFKKDLEINQGRYNSYRVLGNILLEREEYNNAIQLYDKVISFEPNSGMNIEYYLNRGICNHKIKEYSKAMKDYNMTITLCNGFAEMYKGYIQRGLLKIDLSDYRGAISDFNKVINKKANEIDYAYLLRGFAKEEIKDFIGAKNDYSNAILANAKYGIAYYNRGLLELNKLKNKSRACKDLSKAGELGVEKAYDFIKDNCK